MIDPVFSDVVFYHQLVGCEKLALLKDRFNQFTLNSVLDLGCGEGRALMRMHFAFGTEWIEGVDERTSEVTVKKGVEWRIKKNKERSTERQHPLPSCIEDIYEFVRGCKDDVVPRIETREAITNLMKHITYGTSLLEYLPKQKTYDAIVCSQVVQYMTSEEQVKQILSLVRDVKHSKSLIFISVKDGFPRPHIDPIALLYLCDYYTKMLGLEHYVGKVTETQGRVHIYTNL